MGGSNTHTDDDKAARRVVTIRPRPPSSKHAREPNGSIHQRETTYSHDEEVINAAIQQLGSSGGVVHIASGRYKIERSIIVASNITLTGDGHATRLEGYGSGFAIIAGLHNSPDTPFEHVTISNMTLDGSNMVDAGNYNVFTKGIFITYMRYARLLNLYVVNTPATGIGADFLDSSVMHGCVVERCGRQFAELHGSIGGNGIGVGTGGYEWESTTISDCHAIDCGNNGIMFEQQFVTPNSGGMLVTNCVARGSGGAGYRFSGTHHAVLSNSQAINNHTDGVTISESYVIDSPQPSSIKVHDCHIIQNQQHGVFIVDEQSPQKHVKECISITNNEVSRNGRSGIAVHSRRSQLLIESNLLSQNGECAIDVDARDDSQSDIIQNNRGYNPVGVVAGPEKTSASPYLHTAGSSPETVYISNAVLRCIQKDGLTIAGSNALLSNYTVTLQPHQHLLVDYTSPPTIYVEVL